MNQDVNLKIKENIKTLIENGSLEEAKIIINEYKKIKQNDIEIYSIEAIIEIMRKNFNVAEKINKMGLNIDNNNFDLLYNLGYLYEIQNRMVEAVASYTIAKKVCNSEKYKSQIEQIILNISGRNNKKYNVIFYGTMDQCIKFENIFNEWNVIGYIIPDACDNCSEKLLSVSDISDYNYDFIFILSENDDEKIKEVMIKNGAIAFYFYNDFKISVIEGFDYRIRELLHRYDIEAVITGSSYGEVGIMAEQLNKNAINFAFSSQDLYYDYNVFKYVLKFDNIKGSIKYAILVLSYYCFDYDMSKSIAKYRIHRYKDYINDLHNNKDEVGVDISKAFYEKTVKMNQYYDMNKIKEKTVIKYNDKEQEYISKKNATMNYSLSRKENTSIFYEYLKLLKDNNIKPILVICPTSKYYYKYFEDGYQKNKFYKILNKFKSKFDFQIIDYCNSHLFNDNDFWDYGHLNGVGSAKFTKVLNDEIEW